MRKYAKITLLSLFLFLGCKGTDTDNPPKENTLDSREVIFQIDSIVRLDSLIASRDTLTIFAVSENEVVMVEGYEELKLQYLILLNEHIVNNKVLIYHTSIPNREDAIFKRTYNKYEINDMLKGFNHNPLFCYLMQKLVLNIDAMDYLTLHSFYMEQQRTEQYSGIDFKELVEGFCEECMANEFDTSTRALEDIYLLSIQDSVFVRQTQILQYIVAACPVYSGLPDTRP